MRRLLKLGLGAGVLGLLIVVDLLLPSLLPDSSIRQLLMLAACNVLVALSLNVINGMAGQFSIGHAGFIGIGGYASAVIASNLHQSLGGGDPTFARSFIVVPVCLVASAALSGIFGLLVGLPSLRLRGDYLAIVTLGFAEIFRLTIATAQASDSGSPIARLLSRLGGQNGYQGVGNQGVPLYAGPFWVLGIALVLGVVAWRIKFSGWGRALRALREDEIAAAAVGVDPTRYKVTSFVIAAVGAGVAGGLMAIMRDGTPTVNPDNYNFAASFDAITMVILGGSGSVTGAALGGVFITFTIKAIEQVQSSSAIQALKSHFESLDLNALRMIVYAIVLILLMIWRPEGLLGERELFQKRSGRPTTPGGIVGEDGSRRLNVRGHGLMALVLEGVSKSFGGLRAVGDVSFSVGEGVVFGLIGPNGAGKTTVFNLITGVYKPDGGAIRFGTKDLAPLKPAQIAGVGIGRTFQNIRLFGQLTVIENLLVACELQKKAHLASAVLRLPVHYDDEAAMRTRALELLRVFDLHEMAEEEPTSLSYGNQRRLEIARAMMLKPALLLLDEPAAGMNYGEAEGLKTQLRWLRDTFDLSVVLVEHNMQVVMGVCEEIHVLDHGETIAHGTPKEIRVHPKVLAAYLGEEEEGAPSVRAAALELSRPSLANLVESSVRDVAAAASSDKQPIRAPALTAEDLREISEDLARNLERGFLEPTGVPLLPPAPTPSSTPLQLPPAPSTPLQLPPAPASSGHLENVDSGWSEKTPVASPALVTESQPDVATLDAEWSSPKLPTETETDTRTRTRTLGKDPKP